VGNAGVWQLAQSKLAQLLQDRSVITRPLAGTGKKLLT
jgi:hypothetical protein